jgi:hypothetical protein
MIRDKELELEIYTFEATVCSKSKGLWAIKVIRKRRDEGSGKTD